MITLAPKPYPKGSPSGLVWNARIGQWACPTDVCGALCCTQDPWLGEGHEPCQFLKEDKLCGLQKQVGPANWKPMWCIIWPRNQQDINTFNKAVLKVYSPGHPMHGKQCQLRFKP